MKIGTFIFYHPIHAIIEAQKLQLICKEVKGYLPSIVRQFYSNLSENPDKEFLLETIVAGIRLSVDLESITISLGYTDSCHGRVIRNQQYLFPKFPPTVVVKLFQYSGSRVEHRDGFSSYK